MIVAIAILCTGGPFIFMGLSFLMPPKVTGESYAKNANEKVASLPQLGLRGTVVSQIGSELFQYNGKSNSLLYTPPIGLRIMQLTPPNSRGEIALLEFDQTRSRYRFTLLTIKTKATVSTPFQKGDVIWSAAVGSIALHPTQPIVAYFSGTGHHQFRDPQEYWTTGKIHEINCKSGETRVLAKEALDGSFCYEPAGQYLYYPSKLPKSQRDQVPPPAQNPDESTDDPIHGIFRLNLSTLTAMPIAEGSRCYASSDGKLLVVTTGNEKPLTTPWDLRDWSSLPASPSHVWPVQWLNRDVVLASALPLTREDVKFAPWTGSISGRHQLMRLVAMNLKTGQTNVIRTDLDRYEYSAYIP